MKKIIFAFLAFVILSGAAFADKMFFTEAGAAYGNIIDPLYISNNISGVYDTASFDAKIGFEPIKWVDVYGGTSFHYYQERQNWQNYYTFFPVYLGARVNIFPEWCVYPSLFADFGMAFANRHYVTGPTTEKNSAWPASYYNFGLGVNWNVTDIATLCIYIERPSVSNNAGSEIHIIKSGFAWKIMY